jgi:hypothetical protein
MTQFGAPEFDTAQDRRRRNIIYIAVAVVGLLAGGSWLVSGAPFDWPWTWNTHRIGTVAVDRFFRAVERNDLNEAYAIWNHDPSWRQHPARYAPYTFDRFQYDWGPNATDNDYGVIRTHVLKMAHVYGNVLIVGVLVNGRKDKPLFLSFDRTTRAIDFSPDEYYLAP